MRFTFPNVRGCLGVRGILTNYEMREGKDYPRAKPLKSVHSKRLGPSLSQSTWILTLVFTRE